MPLAKKKQIAYREFHFNKLFENAARRLRYRNCRALQFFCMNSCAFIVSKFKNKNTNNWKQSGWWEKIKKQHIEWLKLLQCETGSYFPSAGVISDKISSFAKQKPMNGVKINILETSSAAKSYAVPLPPPPSIFVIIDTLYRWHKVAGSCSNKNGDKITVMIFWWIFNFLFIVFA